MNFEHGLGRMSVKGRKRSPRPPARITACLGRSRLGLECPVSKQTVKLAKEEQGGNIKLSQEEAFKTILRF